MISAEITLAQLVRQYPGAESVLYQHYLDLGNDGNQTLAQVAKKNAIDLNAFINSLDKLFCKQTSDNSWQDASEAELVQHLQSRFHAVHREQLPELIHLARRVETVHGEHTDCPAGLANLLIEFRSEIEQHMQKGELALFPMLLSGRNRMALGPIRIMRHDHQQLNQTIDRLSERTQFLSLPEDACNTWRNLYIGLFNFITDFREHLFLEDKVLFPRIEANALEVTYG